MGKDDRKGGSKKGEKKCVRGRWENRHKNGDTSLYLDVASQGKLGHG